MTEPAENPRPKSPGRWRPLRLALFGIALAVLGRAANSFPLAVEFHRAHLFPVEIRILQALSGWTSSTLGELCAMVGILILLFAAIRFRWRVLGAVIAVAGLVVFGFYVSWGLSYRYPPLGNRLQAITEGPGVDQNARFVALAEAAARLLTRAAMGAPPLAGTEAQYMAQINAGLDEGFARLPASIEAAPVHGLAFGPAKLSRVSFALSRLQLSGYYFPWTGEAQINLEMPRSLWPRVAGHERAHQRGFARENEATVMGLLACLRSSDPVLVYGGALGLFLGLDRELARVDREARSRIWEGMPIRAQDDFRNEAAFWRQYEGVPSKVSGKVNDAYLKSQGVPSGIASYEETARLLLQANDTNMLGLSDLLGPLTPIPGAR